ncbi:primosomal protein N' [Actinotignum sp. GS-2025a]|uniref:primosomal protein N' family DNA-binding protein n=1 Tax=Actinotignum sp. GS-2025a TaxID=3427274 RepID=UPI003F45C74F
MESTLFDFDALPLMGEQGALLEARPARTRVRSKVANPVAHVHVLHSQPHMDRVFDYLIPEKFADTARVGTRVVVDLGAQRVGGFIVARDATTEGSGRLRPLYRVVSEHPVLTASVYSVARTLADKYAGTVADILRAAIPERHARAAKEFLADAQEAIPLASPRPAPEPGPWEAYRGGPEFLAALGAGKAVRACMAALPGPAGGVELLVRAVQAVRRAGRSVLLVVPTTRAARTLQATLATRVGETPTLMVSEESHEKRYRAFLSVLSGQSRIVVGTRGAAWAPLTDLGLAIIMDDAASTLRDIRAPYLAARDVVLERARRENAAFLAFSPYVSEECAQLLSEHRITLLDGTAAARRAALPNISGPHQWPGGEADHLRLPQPAFPILRRALEDGPVLIVVPRSGYIPALCCAYCGERALCAICGGNLAQGRPHDPLQCQLCGVRVHPWRCQHCHNGKLRAIRIGSERTAEEIGRAFPGVGIILSGAHSPEGIIGKVSQRPRIVVATPGAEPEAEGGFAAALVLDARYLLGEGLGAETRFIRVLARVAARVRCAGEGGHMLVAGGAPPELLNRIARWELGEYAAELLEQRAELDLPPTATWVGITGASGDVRTYLAMLRAALNRGEAAAGVRGAAGARGTQGTQGAQDAYGEHLFTQFSPGTGTKEWQPESGKEPEADLLTGGAFELASGIVLLGPVPGARPREITVYARAELSRGITLTRQARKTYGAYSAQRLGGSLRLQVDPPL